MKKLAVLALIVGCTQPAAKRDEGTVTIVSSPPPAKLNLPAGKHRIIVDGKEGKKGEPESTNGYWDNDADGIPDSQDVADEEAYSRIDENRWFDVAKQPLSTFSADVDTASYSNVRRFLAEGQRVPRDAVRIEELINYFPYDYSAPTGNAPFSVTTEVGPCAWNAAHRLVTIGLRGRSIAPAAVPPRNLVFLIDVSGSMDEPRKLPLVRQSMNLLVEQLRAEDRIAIVVYAGNAGMVLPPTAGSKKDQIRSAIAALEAGGSTNGGAGIELAYKLAEKSFLKGGINRVILATDGDWNVGVTSEGDLTRLIEDKRKSGVFLSVLGYGMGNLKDATMVKLADRGNGNYAYIDNLAEARKVLVAQAGATLVTIAKDVKLQVEFNPQVVSSYRLIGYEKRVMAAEDFNDDSKDAGEIGAGHTVTAMYEIAPAKHQSVSSVDPLKYQNARALSQAARSGEVATVKIRYKEPAGESSRLLSFAVMDPQKRAMNKTSETFRFASAVAEYGLLLSESSNKGTANWPQVIELARGARGADPYGYRAEFVRLARIASGDRDLVGTR